MGRERVLEPPVVGLQRESPLEKPGEPGPRVAFAGPLLGRPDELGEGVLEHGVDQLVLGREVAVQRPHTDTRAARDLLDRDVRACGRKQLAGARNQPLTVAPSVAADLRMGRRRCHRGSMPETERSLRFAGWPRAASTSTKLPSYAPRS